MECESRESNPDGLPHWNPESSASANSATLAKIRCISSFRSRSGCTVDKTARQDGPRRKTARQHAAQSKLAPPIDGSGSTRMLDNTAEVSSPRAAIAWRPVRRPELYLRPSVTSFQSSVRKGDAGKPSC